MLISTRQISQPELTTFVNAAVSGGSFSGMMQAYVSSSGYLGNTVVYATGGTQSVATFLAFLTSPTVQYSGSTDFSAASQGFVQDKVVYYVNSLSGTMTGSFVPLYGNTTVNGYKVFTGALGVGAAVTDIDAINLAYLRVVSGVLQTGINSVIVPNVVTTNTAQNITAQKSFDVSPLVVTPTNPSGAVPLSYVTGLNIAGAVNITGDQTINGVKTFVQPPVVPIATQLNQAVPLQQLNALGVSMGGLSGFAGVASINGSTGAASGAVYIQGAGTVTISQCGAIFYVSGITANNTQLYSAQIPLPSGITGFSFTFPTGSGQSFGQIPTITQSLAVLAGDVGFVTSTLYSPSTGGFYVAFSTGIPTTGYALNFTAIPVASGSGFFGLQGADGRTAPSLNSRGVWQVGLVYSNLDWVYQPPVAASYTCTQTHISTADNAPGGTGGLYWAILSSGTQGPTGYWTYRGTYNTGTVYFPANSAYLSGSSYGYTGAFPISGVSPASLNSGWGYVAQAGAIGYFVNSGIITGNFVNLSFFLDPVDSGLNLAEAFVGQTFTMTGFALGCVTSGAGPVAAGAGKLTGSLYVRTLTNTKIALQSFAFDSGVYSYISGGLAITVTGMGRLGLDVTNTLSGIQKFSVGAFGFGF